MKLLWGHQGLGLVPASLSVWGVCVGCLFGVSCGDDLGWARGRSWASTSSLWVPSGTGVLGLVSGFSGRAMLTSGGHICSSHPSLGLLSRLKAGLLGSFPCSDTAFFFWWCNRRASRSQRVASSTSARMGPSPFRTWVWLTRADTSA